jgi:hypothetical protein
MRLVAAMMYLLMVFTPVVRAEGETGADAARATQAATLADDQQRIAEQFRHLEEVLARMSELSGVTDPGRAELLKKAVSLSKERLIGLQIERIAELLEKDSFSRAIESQESLDQDLHMLLELLLSENRARRIESEKTRIRKYLKELNRLIKQEKSIQGRTAGSGDTNGLAEEQGDLAKQTGRLARDIKDNEETPTDPGESAGQPAESQEEKPTGEAGDRDGEPGRTEQAQGDGQKESSNQAQSQAQAKEQDQANEQKQDSGHTPGQQQKQDQHPARPRLEAARQRMQEAQKKLADAQREGALEKQEEAIRELEEAKTELERILRQLREEEIERVLAMLEERFLRMLEKQQEVYEGTRRLDNVPNQEWDRNHGLEARRLSREEADIVLEADKALNLLREDGTAVAFPEAVAQTRGDMEQVVQRLAQAKVGSVTQAIEQDIIAALEEMIESLQKAIKDAEDRRQMPSPNAPMQPQDQGLVDVLAELKMIRALQMRVNRRTDRYSELIDGEQAEDPEVLEALDVLAERQQRIFRITRDLQLGRNR